MAGLTYAAGANVEELFGFVRDQHPEFKDLGKRSTNMASILRGLAKLLKAVNDVRNNASLAHPNELLEEDEAMLAINTAWTALHYIDAKVR